MKRIEQNFISIELPENWELWDQQGMADLSVQLAAKTKNGKYPNLEITKIGKVPDPNVEKTKSFARSWLNKRRLNLISDRYLKVTNRDAYEFSYFSKPIFFLRGKYFCKVSVIRFGIEYLIQLSSRKLEKDKPVFDKIVQSMKFEFSTE